MPSQPEVRASSYARKPRSGLVCVAFVAMSMFALTPVSLAQGDKPAPPADSALKVPASASQPEQEEKQKADTPGKTPPEAAGSVDTEPKALKDWAEAIAAIAGAVVAVAGLLATLTKSGRRFVRGFLRLIADVAREPKREQEALAEFREKFGEAPPLADIMAKYPGRFTAQIKVGGAVSQAIDDGAKMVVIASGKGGVGKSTLALGLLETWCADGKTTLLVDFDMHNRGLTSLLRSWEYSGHQTSCFAEAARFDAEMRQPLKEFYEAATKQASEGKPSDGAKLLDLMDTFARTKLPDGAKGPYRSLDVKPMVVGSVDLGDGKVIRGKDPWFLQSLARNEHYLGSEMFAFSSNDTFFFLKFIQYWASHCKMKFDRIILDCHGAQDLMMIGAIHSASGLVIATTPEPGAFDGTYDLLAFANLLRSNKSEHFPTILAVNNCRSWQDKAALAMENFARNNDKGVLIVDDVIRVESDDDVRRVTSKYSLGTAYKKKRLKQACEKIVAELEKSWSGRSPAAVAVAAPPQEATRDKSE